MQVNKDDLNDENKEIKPFFSNKETANNFVSIWKLEKVADDEYNITIENYIKKKNEKGEDESVKIIFRLSVSNQFKRDENST